MGACVIETPIVGIDPQSEIEIQSKGQVFGIEPEDLEVVEVRDETE